MDAIFDSRKAVRSAPATVSPNATPRLHKVKKDRPKRTLISAACEECRARKAKCDGGRPRCARCTRGRKACSYNVNPGETRQAAAKQKTESLQSNHDLVLGFLDSLRSNPLSDARLMLDQLRASQDVDSFLKHLRTTVHKTPSADSSQRSSESADRGFSLSEDLSRRGKTSSDSPDPYSLPQRRSSVVDSGASMRNLSSPGLELPDEHMLRNAIRMFYQSTAKIFHVFSRQQIEFHLNTMLTKRDAAPKSVICGVCCVGAVGVLFMGKLCETEKSAHRMARILLDDVIEESPLEAAKCCALFALYNVMSKATVALAYLEIGMDLMQRENSPALHCVSLSQHERLDRKKAWRCLMFLACWTSSTLGYVSSSEWMSPKDNFREVEIEGETEIEDIVQTEMVKLAMLKHAILRMDVTLKHQSSTSLEIVRQDLHQWHRDLPAAMRLTNLLNNPDLKTGVRTSIYIVHLLYLGSLMLLYRQFLNQTPPPIDEGTHGLFFQIHTDAVTAAQQSSRILNLLRADNCVVQRCWISIYQSYCATLLILHGIAQKLMQPSSQVSYADDLDQARRCLEVLDFCGEVDAVAAKFCNLLRPFYKALHSMAVSRGSPAASPDSGLPSICAELFSLVRRPFGDFHPQGVLSNGNGSPDDPFCPAVMANPLAPAGTISFGWSMLNGADDYGSGSGSGSSSTLLGNLGPAKFLDGVPHGWLDNAETRASAMEF